MDRGGGAWGEEKEIDLPGLTPNSAEKGVTFLILIFLSTKILLLSPLDVFG